MDLLERAWDGVGNFMGSLMHGFEQLGADAMATTEKDAVNLPQMAEELPVFYLRIAMEIEREQEFLASL